MKFANMSLMKKNILISCVPLILFVVLCVVSVMSLRSLLDSARWVDHTYNVIWKAMKIQTLAVNMETGERGFLLTGKQEFLEPYNRSEKAVYEEITSLQKAVVDNPSQVKRLDEINDIIRTWQEKVLKPAIALRRKIGEGKDMNDIAALVGEAKGKQYFDTFRGQIRTFIEREEHQKASDVIPTVMNIMVAAVDMETGMRGYLLTGKEAFLDPYRNGDKVFRDRSRDLEKILKDNPPQVQLLGEIKKMIKEWQENVAEPAIELRRKIAQSKTMADMREFISEGQGKIYFDTLRGIISTFMKTEEDLMTVRQADSENRSKNTMIVIVAGTVLTIFIALVFSFYFTGITTKPILKAVDLAEAIGQGDFSQRLDIHYDDEIGKLTQALNLMARDLEDKDALIRKNMKDMENILRDVSYVSDQLTDVSRQVSDSSTSLSEDASEQAASLEQMTSSMIEIGTQSKANSKNAFRASQLADQTQEAAGHGMNEMENMISSMEDINAVSQAIAKIIKVIDEIAFQTNLLALNAAVEAARAGRHGKGFAVVAGEVRNLAGRSANAAKETSELIEDAVKKIENGYGIAGQTAEAFNRIVESVREVAALVSDIAASSDEQSMGIAQVNQGLTQLDQVTQQNTANAEETASVSEELFAQASQLQDIFAQSELKRNEQLPVRTHNGNFPREASVPAQRSKRADTSISEDFQGLLQEEIALDDEEFGKY